MARRRGLQAEVLLSLAVVMLTATAVLGALLLKTHDAQLEQLQRLAARGLLDDLEGPLPATAALVPELRWWRVAADQRATARGAHADSIDAASLELARRAREEGRALLRSGRPWEPLRFAAPVGASVAVAELPPAASGGVLLLVLAADVLVFTAFGATLLRSRLVRPLQRLDAAARAIAEGDFAARVPADGPRETWDLARSFNAMADRLEARTQALEKAVAELRESNRHLRDARAGLDRAERLAAVGRLAAGVAHEVGNPMGAVLGFVDLVRRDAGLSEASRGHLERALRESERVRRILRQLLDFSRPPRTERVELDVAAVCEETAGLVRAQRRYAALRIEVESQGAPPPALADRNAVAQIVLNLLINAADALCASGRPDPRIRVIVRPAAARLRVDDREGTAPQRAHFDRIECRVEDNGPGVAADARAHVFDPFFTTKEPGEGTGLGLANALRYAEELGGGLDLLDDEEAGGAVFALWLPTAGASDADGLRES